MNDTILRHLLNLALLLRPVLPRRMVNRFERSREKRSGKSEVTDLQLTSVSASRFAAARQDEGFLPYDPPAPITPKVKLIAFYLPQFHPFPENDAWWGKGFTEWTNVGKALPNFAGHYQPHCPIHFGYYDLRVPSVMEEQAKVLKEYGLHGFSYYFYWFGGKTLMEAPLRAMLANPAVDAPFCLTWANENWTRRWDGQERDILIGQNHSRADSLNLLRHIAPYFADPRYIRIDGKPVFIIYRANIIPEIDLILTDLRAEAVRLGFPGLYLVAAQSFGIGDPRPYGFDAAVEFPPHGVRPTSNIDGIEITNPDYKGEMYDYRQVVDSALAKPEPDYKLFRAATLSWDNTARRQNNSHIMLHFSIARYRQWLSTICRTVADNPKYAPDEKLVFINAWNEWAEGTHLEPDRRHGFGYLKATYDAVADL